MDCFSLSQRYKEWDCLLSQALCFLSPYSASFLFPFSGGPVLLCCKLFFSNLLSDQNVISQGKINKHVGRYTALMSAYTKDRRSPVVRSPAWVIDWFNNVCAALDVLYSGSWVYSARYSLPRCDWECAAGRHNNSLCYLSVPVRASMCHSFNPDLILRESCWVYI